MIFGWTWSKIAMDFYLTRPLKSAVVLLVSDLFFLGYGQKSRDLQRKSLDSLRELEIRIQKSP